MRISYSANWYLQILLPLGNEPWPRPVVCCVAGEFPMTTVYDCAGLKELAMADNCESVKVLLGSKFWMEMKVSPFWK